MAAHLRSGAVGHFIDQVHTAGLVDVHFTVDQTGKRDGNGSAAGALHNHVNEVLRERIECDASRIQTAILALIPTAALAGDVPQCRQPVQRAVLLSLRPLADDVDQVAQVLPGALLIEVKRGLGLIAFANQCSSFDWRLPSKRWPSRSGRRRASIEPLPRHLRKRGVSRRASRCSRRTPSKSRPPPSACRGRRYLRRSRRGSPRAVARPQRTRTVLSERGCKARRFCPSGQSESATGDRKPA